MIYVNISDKRILVSTDVNTLLSYYLSDSPLSINRAKSIVKQIKQDAKTIRKNNIKVTISGLDISLKKYIELFDEYNTEYIERSKKFNYLISEVSKYNNVEVNSDILNDISLLKLNNKLSISNDFDLALSFQKDLINLCNEINNIKNNIDVYKKDLIEIKRAINLAV